MQNVFEQFRQIIQHGNRFVLTTHVNPDPDAIGSELAMARFLTSLGKIVAVLNHSATPAYCTFLDPKSIIEQFDPPHHANMVLNADVIIVLDANQPERLQSLKPYLLSSKAVKVCIDHHPDKTPFADLYIVDESTAATGEILYEIFHFLDENSLTADIASPLYAAIMTDTGSFRFPKTDPALHRIVANLIERGADPVETYRRIYEQGTANRLQLLGGVLSTLQLAHGGKVATMFVTREMFQRTSTSEEDVESFINYTLSIGGVQIGLLFTELPDGVKVSFRSRGEIEVNKLAQEFGGNGHKNAAGARIPAARLKPILEQVVVRSLDYIV
jgi:bifunctional oligoribonuclease and PAP phosphatase NrnA